MRNRDFPILPLLSLIAIGLCAYWLYKNVELETVEYPAGQNEEARANKFLAAVRLLKKEDFSFNIAKDRRVFSSLDVSTTDVLWIANLNVLSYEQEVDDIYAWVESGGTLLTSPQSASAFNESTVSGRFLNKVGISPLNENELAINRANSEILATRGGKVYHLNLPESNQTSSQIELMQVREPYFKINDAKAENAQVIVDSPLIIQKRIGKGFVTVYAENRMFDNYRIGTLDSGYLLLWLTAAAEQKKLSIVFNPAEKPGLLQVLWSRFTLAILVSGFVLAGFLRWASSRLGPVEHELAPIQNNIMAHLQARGEYWYRHNYTDKIAENIQSTALENLVKQRALSDQEHMSTEVDRAASIKQASNLLQCSPVTAEKALFGRLKNDNAILSSSRILQKINHRKSLQP